MIDVICVKVGDKYGVEYVHRLHAMVKKHLTVPHIFRCLTDKPKEINSSIFSAKINDTTLEGWWAKMLLFDLSPWIYPIIFLDLDTIIVNNIDFLTSQKSFSMLRDFFYPEKYASGLMVVDSAHSWVWHTFAKRRDHYQKQPTDQHAIEEILREKNDEPAILQDLFPGKIVSYKASCRQNLPPDAAIVCFHGHPKPHEASGHWIIKHWIE